MARVLYVSSEGIIGGAETSLLLLVKYLRTCFSVDVACPVPSPLSQALEALKVDRHALPQPRRASGPSSRCAGYWLATVRQLTRAIRTTRADLVHANSFYAGAASLVATLTTRRRLLLHARDLADFGVLTRLYDRYAERVIAVSHAVKCALASKGARPERIEVVYNGYDFRPGHRARSYAGVPAPPSSGRTRDFVFAHVGQCVPWKNHAVFLDAAAYVADRLPQSQFAVIGDDLFQRHPSYKQKLFNMARLSSAAGRIHFWGWQTNMEAVWPRIDCLVHTAEREPFGRVVVEAMAHRIPVIAVAAAGPAEIIQADRTGVLVPTTAVHTLGEAMLRLARDREFAATIAVAGYRRARSSFTASQTAARVQHVYEDILST